MSNKPIFVATHPRACSTAFERVFMTRRDILRCVHEPFGDAFYFGPERLSDRYEEDKKAREESGFENSTYRTIFERIAKESSEGKRLFIKDITHYLVPPNAKPATTAPSLVSYKRGVGTTPEGGLSLPVDKSAKSQPDKIAPYPYDTQAESGNPSVVPEELLKQFHFTFLIRHPKFSIPSYWRCTIPPLDEITGFYNFMSSEAGYDELRRVFDYVRERKIIGPKIAGRDETTNSSNGTNGDHADEVEICVIDADDLLDNPKSIIKQYCKTTGLEYKSDMLTWDTEEEHSIAKAAFEKWKGFHEDAINSSELKARIHKTTKSDAEIYADWTKKYGEEAAKSIQACVDQNVADYEYLKSFAIKP